MRRLILLRRPFVASRLARRAAVSPAVLAAIAVSAVFVAFVFLAAAPLSAFAAAPSLRNTILVCDFDSKPLDQVIGTGGAAANEPTSLANIAATVRATPLPTPSLEIVDNSNNARAVRFEFLDDVEIISGMLVISMVLECAEREDFIVRLRENDGSAVSFLDLYFFTSGDLRFSDLDTPTSAATIGTYEAGVPFTVHFILDMDTREYDILLDADVLVDDEPLGDSPVGIGSVSVGFNSDLDTAGTIYLDDLVVSATVLPTPVTATSWGAIKARWR